MKTTKLNLNCFAFFVALVLTLPTSSARGQSCAPSNERPPQSWEVEAQPRNIVATVDSVVYVTALEGSLASNNNRMSLASPRAFSLYMSLDVTPGAEFSLGKVRGGTELIFQLESPDRSVFQTGPGSRNPDNLVHAKILRLPGTSTFIVGWEDLYAGGDFDYDDVIFQVCLVPLADADSDGTPDEEEAAGPGGGDANGDAIPDLQQPYVSARKELMSSYINGTRTAMEMAKHVTSVAADPRKVREERVAASQAGATESAFLKIAMRNTANTLANMKRPPKNETDVQRKESEMKQQATLSALTNVMKMMHQSASFTISKLTTTHSSRRNLGARKAPRGTETLLHHARVAARPPDELFQVVQIVELPEDIQPNTYYNYGPTHDNPEPHAYEFLFDGVTGAEFIEGGVLLHFVDGQRGDHDLTVNGAIDTEGAFVELQNQTPVASAQNLSRTAGSDCHAKATAGDFDNGSSDPENHPLTFTVSPEGPYPIGTTEVVLTVTDKFGASSTAPATVHVVDTTPPEISNASVTPSVIWPPNKRMVDVTVNYDVNDCQPVTTSLSISSDEPTAIGQMLVVDPHHLRLVADRLGSGASRTYTITITATDASGNASTRLVTVRVPHDRR